MKECFAPDCHHKQGVHKCTMHRFPTTPSRIRWIRSTRRADRLPSKFDVMCGCHFSPGSQTPTRFKRNPKYTASFTPIGNRRSRKRLLESGEPDLFPNTNTSLTSTIDEGSHMSTAHEEEVLATPLPPDDVEVSLPELGHNSDTPRRRRSYEEYCCDNPQENQPSDSPQENQPSDSPQENQPSPSVSDMILSHKKAKKESMKIIRIAGSELKCLRKRIEEVESEKRAAVLLAWKSQLQLINAQKEKCIVEQEKDRVANVLNSVIQELEELKKNHGNCVNVTNQLVTANEKVQSECRILRAKLEGNCKILENCQKDLTNANLVIDGLTADLCQEKYRLCFKHISESEEKVNYYTGLPNKGTFDWLLSLFDGLTLTYYTGKNVKVLSYENQLFMTLMMLRTGTSRGLLADWFKVSKQTVTNIVRTWISALHTVLFKGFMSEVPSLEKNRVTLPECFNDFKNCRMILDCLEMRMCVPKKLKVHNLVFSHYKHYTTLKGLLGVAPNGVPTFASELFPGSTSDKAIVQKCGVMNVFKAGESVMVDKGFLINEMCPEGVTVCRPPFLTTPQFTKEQVVKSKKISQARIHVERAIRRVKCFRVLEYIPSKLVPVACEVFQVCVALTTLLPPLIKEVEAAMKNMADVDFD